MNPFTTAPFGPRFPLSSPGGLVIPEPDPPSESANRPFGMRYGVAPIEAGAHSKQPTQKSRKKQTAIYDDGKVSGYEEDVEYYTEMDEE